MHDVLLIWLHRHGGMKMGLLKAMMVLNWLNTYEF